MSFKLKTILSASVFAFAMAFSGPVLAEDTKTDTTTTASTTSDPQGLGSAYNYSVSTAGTGCCRETYDHDNANDNAKIIMTNFNQKLAAMQLAIIEALRLGTGQITGNLAQQTGASHTLADQQDDRATVKSVEQQRMEALQEATSGSTTCFTATGSTGGTLAGSVGQATLAYSSELDKWARGESTYSKDGQERADLARIDAYCNNYATQADIDSKLCKNSKPSAYPAASVNASESIFYKGDSGMAEVYDGKRALAANAFILNALVPVPYPTMNKAQSQSPQGRKAAARMKTQMARDSIGRHIAVEYIKMRDPQKVAPTLTSWAKARATKIPGMENVDLSKLSYQQWLSIYAQGFLLDTQSLINSDESSVTAIKDMKNMSAVNTYVNYQILEQLQNINLQLAAQTAILNEQTRNDGVFAK